LESADQANERFGSRSRSTGERRIRASSDKGAKRVYSAREREREVEVEGEGEIER
jgi:hypothetical protein